MSNLLVNTRDQQFVLFEQLGIEDLFKSEAYKDFSKDDLLMVLSEAEKMAVNVIAPTFKEGDEEGCHFNKGKVTVPKCFHDAWKLYTQAGWINPMDPPEIGGQGLPAAVGFAVLELFGSANYAFCMYPGL
ncbi:MAG: acyl-CoA dehydrogenase N-terminal domain-containing protein, partial [Syntrophales bacterium]|nr:acyl-CoA dehydrogenase N-terminal domain-containing protein [Syntrophales bacterium]